MPHPFSFIAEANPAQRRTLVAAALGWMLDAFDVMLYSLVVAYIMCDLHMSKQSAGLLNTLTLLASGIGGVLFGFIANYSILRRREIHWSASLLSSLIGAGIVFAAGYALVLNSTTVQDTWLIALGLATIGGVLGVSAAKLALGRLISTDDAPFEEDATPTE